jgi:predicted ArsR family transcriptional regulator
VPGRPRPANPDREHEAVSIAKRRLIEHLKHVRSATTPALADAFALTDTAVRQHLEGLESLGFVERHPGPSGGRGRPPTQWSLTDAADAFFPDRHRDFTVELLEALHSAFGDAGTEAVLAARAERQLIDYRAVFDASSSGAPASLASTVERLAHLRSDEGYDAEVRPGANGDEWVLVEHHCPVSDAARACPALCASELDLFRNALGDTVEVERTEHLLQGSRCCTYVMRVRAARST